VKRPLRVALLSDRFPPDAGGVARAAQRLALGLAAAGDEVEVHTVTDDPPGTVAEDCPCDGLRVLRLGGLRHIEDTLADAFELIVRRHTERPYDLVHGFYLARSGFLAAYAGAFLGAPSVVSARGNDLDRSVFGADGTRVLHAIQSATCVTGVSRELTAKAAALCPAARVEWIPNGVDAELFRPLSANEELRRALGLSGREVLGFSGELRLKKGIVPLLESVARLARTRPISLLLAGGARADAAGVLAVFRTRQPDVQVVELPQRAPAELPAIYALMDVFLHPSLRDGLPNALLEAMACARPVIAARAGGIPDVVRDGIDGVLVAPGNSAALCAAIVDLLEDAPRAAAMGRAARARVMSDFSPQSELRAYRDLYRELSTGARRASGGVLALASK
jgi:glycosyltransferase involved in cell wall biosynthesis